MMFWISHNYNNLAIGHICKHQYLAHYSILVMLDECHICVNRMLCELSYYDSFFGSTYRSCIISSTTLARNVVRYRLLSKRAPYSANMIEFLAKHHVHEKNNNHAYIFIPHIYY